MSRPRTGVGRHGAVTFETSDDSKSWRKVAAGERAPIYRARTQLRCQDGRLRRVTAQGKSRAEASRALMTRIDVILSAPGKVTGAYRANMTVGDAVLAHVADVESENRSARTVALYRNATANHIASSEIDMLLLSEVQPSVLARFLQDVANTSGPGMAKTVRSLLSGAFTRAVRDGAIPANPISGGRVPVARARSPKAATRQAGRALSATELAALLEFAASDPRMARNDMRDLIEYCALVGARAQEVLGQRWDDVSLERGEITIRDSDNPRGTKTGKVRTIGIGAELRLLLERRATRCSEGYLFPTPTLSNPNSRRDYANFLHLFKRCAKATGVEWATPHTMRTTCATRLIESGMSLPKAAAYIGDSVETFARHYVSTVFTPAELTA